MKRDTIEKAAKRVLWVERKVTAEGIQRRLWWPLGGAAVSTIGFLNSGVGFPGYRVDAYERCESKNSFLRLRENGVEFGEQSEVGIL